MRKIKFRALAVVNDKHNNIKVGDFVYGSFIESGVDAPCIIFGDGDQIEIDRKTLGQLTGLVDKNNAHIFEGDIVKWGHVNNFIEHRPRVAIVSLAPSLNFSTVNLGKHNHKFHYGNFAYADSINKAMEILGNKHQNPGLLGADNDS